MAVDDVHDKWRWKAALGKFDSVTPGKKIWFVHPKPCFQSVVVLRLTRPQLVNFKYRGAANDRISVDFPAGRKRILRDIPVTAAGFEAKPSELNEWFGEKCAEAEQLFVLGLARAECWGPDGYNRWEEVPDRLKRQVDVDSLGKYCQVLLIGVLACPKEKAFAKLPLEACKREGIGRVDQNYETHSAYRPGFAEEANMVPEGCVQTTCTDCIGSTCEALPSQQCTMPCTACPSTVHRSQVLKGANPTHYTHLPLTVCNQVDSNFNSSEQQR